MLDYLLRGHAIHFRCQAAEARNVRVDVMATMRGVAPVEELWSRRTTIRETESGTTIGLLALPDLVAAKHTQRDKDWPMLRRLVEAHFARHQGQPSEDDVRFWLAQSTDRSDATICDSSNTFGSIARSSSR